MAIRATKQGEPDPETLLAKQLQGSGDRHGPQWGAGAKPHMRQQDCGLLLNNCRGLGTVTVPSGVQGQSPCGTARFPKANFRRKFAQRAQNRPAGATLGGRQPDAHGYVTENVWTRNQNFRAFRFLFDTRPGSVFSPNQTTFCPLSVGLPPSRSAPAGRFGRAAPICGANGLR